MTNVTGNVPIPPMPEGGKHSGHSKKADKRPKEEQKVNPCQTAVQKPGDTPTSKTQKKTEIHTDRRNQDPGKSDKEGKKEEDQDKKEHDRSKDVLDDNESHEIKKFLADYGGNPFGGSKNISPEKDGFW
ncbi:MAG: hypothetical protein WCG42_07200 [Parachlamydiaceae bacterium]